jgi:hypothetical protein
MLSSRVARSSLRSSNLDVVFEVSSTVTVAAYRHVSIVVWRETATVASLLRVDEYFGTLYEKYPRLAAVVVLDSPTLRPPDQPARLEHARLTTKYEAKSVGLAMVIDGNSAKHSVFRFVLTTLQLMSSPRVPQRIFQTTDEAAEWLAGVDPSLARSELASAIKAARALTAPPANVLSA